MDKFKNKYRIPSARYTQWDYGNEASYFITICTKDRENYFGKILSESSKPTILQPTQIGNIAHIEWYKTLIARPDMNLQFGEFVVMPNHIHAIITIGENKFNTAPSRDAMHNDDDRRDAMHNDDDRRDAMHCVSTNPYKNDFAPQSKNLSSIVRGYKSSVTTFARKNGIDFEWQPRFHDHIIRSADSYNNISHYIKNNPSQWVKDKFYIRPTLATPPTAAGYEGFSAQHRSEAQPEEAGTGDDT